MNKCTLTPYRELRTEQNEDSTKVQPGEPEFGWDYLLAEGILVGVEMAQWQLYHQSLPLPTPPTQAWVVAHKISRQLNRLENVHLSLFQVAWLVFAFSSWMALSESIFLVILTVFVICITWEGKVLMNLLSLGDFLSYFELLFFLPVLMSFPEAFYHPNPYSQLRTFWCFTFL